MAYLIIILLILLALIILSAQLTPSRSVEKSGAEIRSIIFAKLRDIAELSSVREDFIATVNLSKSRQIAGINLPFTKGNFQMMYTGTIVCGCDLSAVQVYDADINGSHAVLRAPACKILHVYPNVNSFMIQDNSGLLAPKISLEEQNALVAADLESQKRRAIAEGILERTASNIRQILVTQMRAIGVEAEVVFEAPPEQKLLR